MTPGDVSQHPSASELGRVRAAIDEAVREIAAAFALLTRLPVGRSDAARSEASGAIAFPLVGAVVGLIGAVPLVLVGWIQPLASLLALATIAVVTGALHLDGLADTADALLAPNRARAEQARKDPAVGPGGAVTLLLVVAIEASALASIASGGSTWLAAGAMLVAVVAGRTIAVVATVVERARVAPDGFGAWFAARVRPLVAGAAAILAVLIVAPVAFLIGSAALALGGAIGAGLGLLIAYVLVAWRGQLDGDGLGAVIELTVAAVLVVTAIIVPAPVP